MPKRPVDKKPAVIIIDDDPFFARPIQQALKNFLKIDAEIFEDTTSAIGGMIRLEKEGKTIKAIICDTNLEPEKRLPTDVGEMRRWHNRPPNMNGPEFAAKLKSPQFLAKTGITSSPYFILTSMMHINASKEPGVNKFICQDEDDYTDKIVDAVDKVLNGRSRS